ncbi:MAG TPA: hypothetical protein VK550_28320 [Polyangiaceae bacterium]|nr:hypothetical protein [Polyangiaceae bacterium]
MTRNRNWWGPLPALLALACAAVGQSGCASSTCEESDSCGAYPWPDVRDGAEGAEAPIPDVAEAGTIKDADGGTEASRDASADAVVDGDPDAAVRPDTRDDIDAGRDVNGDAAFDAGGDATVDDATADADGGVVADADAGPTCDVTKSPVDEPCLVDDRYGVFVSAGGSDTAGLGTKASPYKTVTKGLAAAQAAQGKNVYVCAATYAEAVTVEGSLDGSRLFGGFDCRGWAYSASNRPMVKPATGPALVAKALTKGLRVEDVEFDAPATMTSGESSVAAWVTGSANVRLVRVKLVAAAAQAGADGVAASNYDPLLQQNDATIAGKNAMGATGGATQTCATLCANGQNSTGGKGGDGGPGSTRDAGLDGGADAGAPTAGANGGPAITPPDPPSNDGVGGNPQIGVLDCTNGARGSNAPAKPGGIGATQPGSLTANGWTRADGTTATAAGPGQGGGGGGGGQIALGGGGGGGGCGGCGGAAGPGGQSGGSSFALLSYQSTVMLDACTLVAGAGGNGGKGADGQAGQMGGFGGDRTAPGCTGGNGGQGGAAGGGGGGAGGHSVAFGYVGQAPTQMNGTTSQVASQPAASGAAGAGGSPTATAGAAGKAQTALDLM